MEDKDVQKEVVRRLKVLAEKFNSIQWEKMSLREKLTDLDWPKEPLE